MLSWGRALMGLTAFERLSMLSRGRALMAYEKFSNVLKGRSSHGIESI